MQLLCLADYTGYVLFSRLYSVCWAQGPTMFVLLISDGRGLSPHSINPPFKRHQSPLLLLHKLYQQSHKLNCKMVLIVVMKRNKIYIRVHDNYGVRQRHDNYGAQQDHAVSQLLTLDSQLSVYGFVYFKLSLLNVRTKDYQVPVHSINIFISIINIFICIIVYFNGFFYQSHSQHNYCKLLDEPNHLVHIRILAIFAYFFYCLEQQDFYNKIVLTLSIYHL